MPGGVLSLWGADRETLDGSGSGKGRRCRNCASSRSARMAVTLSSPSPGAARALPCRSMSGSGLSRSARPPGSPSTRSKWRVPCDPRRSRHGSAPVRLPKRSPTRPVSRSSACAGSRARSSASGPTSRSRRRPPRCGGRVTLQGLAPGLRDIVPSRLKAAGADPADGQWDSRKRGDGNWQVTLTFTAGGTAARRGMDVRSPPPSCAARGRQRRPAVAARRRAAAAVGAHAWRGDGDAAGPAAGRGVGWRHGRRRPCRGFRPARRRPGGRFRSQWRRPVPRRAPGCLRAAAAAERPAVSERPAAPERPAMSHPPAASPTLPRPAHRDPLPERPPVASGTASDDSERSRPAPQRPLVFEEPDPCRARLSSLQHRTPRADSQRASQPREPAAATPTADTARSRPRERNPPPERLPRAPARARRTPAAAARRSRRGSEIDARQLRASATAVNRAGADGRSTAASMIRRSGPTRLALVPRRTPRAPVLRCRPGTRSCVGSSPA